MSEVTIGLLGLAVVLVLFLTGIELAFAMALVGFLGFSYIVSLKAGLNLLAKDFFDVFASYGFTVIPLFSSCFTKLVSCCGDPFFQLEVGCFCKPSIGISHHLPGRAGGKLG